MVPGCSWLFLVVLGGSVWFLVVPHGFLLLCFLGVFGGSWGFLKNLVGICQFLVVLCGSLCFLVVIGGFVWFFAVFGGSWWFSEFLGIFFGSR